MAEDQISTDREGGGVLVKIEVDTADLDTAYERGGQPMNTNQNPQTGQISVPKLMAVLSDILSEKYGVKITMTATPKASTEAEAPAA